jgi:serine phosphatase RsbU (regulator of sigma subunit)
MTDESLGQVLRAVQASDPTSVPDVVSRLAARFGGSDVVVYLVDFAQETLEPLPDRRTHAHVPVSEAVGTTATGRAFVDQQPVVVQRTEGARIWVPVVEGSDRTGVVAVSVERATDDIVNAAEDLGVLAGYLIATHSRSTDLYNLRRRRRALSLAASMQWDLLPPLVLKTELVSLAGLIEPAYDVGGDCFDYAVNGTVLDLAIADPVGHQLRSALLAALCLGCYRHDRRENRSLEQIDRHLDDAVRSQFPGAFATGQLVRLDLRAGTVRWANAGHPVPLLIRGGRVVGELEAEPGLPWGIKGHTPDRHLAVATASLEPGDQLLFYTDGVVEAHEWGGEQFGVDRLADLVGQQTSDQQEPEETVRRVVRAVLDHQGDLADDATLVLVRWPGPA